MIVKRDFPTFLPRDKKVFHSGDAKHAPEIEIVIEIEIVVEFAFGILCMHVHHKKRKRAALKDSALCYPFLFSRLSPVRDHSSSGSPSR